MKLKLFKAYGIGKIRFFNPNPKALNALTGSINRLVGERGRQLGERKIGRVVNIPNMKA